MLYITAENNLVSIHIKNKLTLQEVKTKYQEKSLRLGPQYLKISRVSN